MKAKDFIRVQQLVKTLDTQNKAKLDKIMQALGLKPWENISKYLDLGSSFNFLKSWENYDTAAEKFEDILTRIQKSKRVKDFFREPFNSGYSMGEIETLVINAEINGVKLRKEIVIRDTRKAYAGSGRKYNGKIV